MVIRRSMAQWLRDPLVYALTYSGRGWPVLPVRSLVDGRCDCGKDHDGDTSKYAKHPRTLNGSLDASTDEDRIREWWAMWPNANVGIATIEPSLQLAIFDIDPRHGGEATWTEANNRRELPPHPVVKTGSGGEHHYFTGAPSRVGRDAFGSGVDIVAGNRYAIAPPSVTVGGSYAWVGKSYGIEPPPIPERLLPAPKETRTATVTLEFPTNPRYALGALRDEFEQARARRDGQGRRDHLYEAGLKLSRFVLSGYLRADEIVSVLTAAGVESGLGSSDAASHVQNGLNLGLTKGASA